MIWNGIYDLTIGPVCFVIICECSATRVRSKTIALATAVQALAGIVMTVAIPYMINPDQVSFDFSPFTPPLLFPFPPPFIAPGAPFPCFSPLTASVIRPICGESWASSLEVWRSCASSGVSSESQKPRAGRTRSWISCSKGAWRRASLRIIKFSDSLGCCRAWIRSGGAGRGWVIFGAGCLVQGTGTDKNSWSG